METLRKLSPVVLLFLLTCESDTTAPIYALNARIVDFHACKEIVAGGCRGIGDLLNPENPRDTAAVPWREPFIIHAESDWATRTRWRVEWPECRRPEGSCWTTPDMDRNGGENQQTYASGIFLLDMQYWVIFEAQLVDRVAADTVGFDPPVPFDTVPIPEKRGAKS